MPLSHEVRHRGQVVVLGGNEYVMPPLSLRQAQVYWPQMASLQDGGFSPLQALELAADVAHACLVRNYPELPRANFGEWVDLDNFEQLLAAAGGGRSFKNWLETVRAETEGAPAGNARPQPPTPTATDGTGAPSTPASPPPPAGDSSASTS